MRTHQIFLGPTIAAVTALLASAAPAKPAAWDEFGVEASIAFPNNGGIRNFETNEERGLWIEDRQRRWYYARIMGACHDLRNAQAIAFETRGSSSLDRFGAIRVGRERCQLESLITAEKPLPRRERLKMRKEVRAEAAKAVAPRD